MRKVQKLNFFCVVFVLFALFDRCYLKPTSKEQETEANTLNTEHEVNTLSNEPDTTTLSSESESSTIGSEPESNTLSNEIDLSNTDELRIPEEELNYRAVYAKQMMLYMNKSVEPCNDFYEYACGNWKNVIQERQSHHKRSNLLDIVYRLGDVVDDLLQRPAEKLGLNYNTELELTQKFYQSCLNADLYPMKRSQAYLDVINSIVGFPALNESWTADNFSWFNASSHLSNYGSVGFINEEILPQYPFSPYFKLPEMGFDSIVHSDNIASNSSRGYMLNEKRMREYLTTYGLVEPNITHVINDIFGFWTEVLKVMDEFEEDADRCQLLSVTLTEPFQQWNNYYKISWKNINFNFTNSSAWSSYGLCPCDYFYVKLDELCNKHKEAAANYLALKFLYDMDARLEDKKFQKEYCTMKLHSALPYLIDKLYLATHFNDEISEEVTTIVREIRKSLRDILEQADWLDESTRAEALLKESTIVPRIGNFDDPEMTDRLIKEMKNLSFAEDDYALNNINLHRFKTSIRRFNGLHYDQINNNTKPLELLVGMQVNAFYYNVDNSINVMAGILHPPAYHKAWPNSLKFGTLGYLIGHEFTHGFDSIGAMFDSTGDERYWWSKKSSKVFDERANCYVDHYNNYLIPEINRKVNGNQTKDENIADGGGLREALNAYRRYMKDLIRETEQETALLKAEQLPGLDLSPEQLFFLGFAQIWCAAYKEEHYWEELTNEHTMDKYRVLGAVTNYEDFAKAYNCSLGSKMNPKIDKCRVW